MPKVDMAKKRTAKRITKRITANQFEAMINKKFKQIKKTKKEKVNKKVVNAFSIAAHTAFITKFLSEAAK